MQDSVFTLKSAFTPTGDQPEAIDTLVRGIEEGRRAQTLLGVTGSGKTFTMANVIARCGRPTLILEPNKTLAAQVCSELREFFPENAVEFFVSYYDYYQPEAYIPGQDMYIEKDAMINANPQLSWQMLKTKTKIKSADPVSAGRSRRVRAIRQGTKTAARRKTKTAVLTRIARCGEMLTFSWGSSRFCIDP